MRPLVGYSSASHEVEVGGPNEWRVVGKRDSTKSVGGEEDEMMGGEEADATILDRLYEGKGRNILLGGGEEGEGFAGVVGTGWEGEGVEEVMVRSSSLPPCPTSDGSSAGGRGGGGETGWAGCSLARAASWAALLHTSCLAQPPSHPLPPLPTRLTNLAPP